jgi:hypothetical protein
MPETTSGRIHSFFATAFVENFPLKELAAPTPRPSARLASCGSSPPRAARCSSIPFGAVVFFDVAPEVRASELHRLVWPGRA